MVSGLTAEQGKELLAVRSTDSLRDKRDYAILSLLLGCGLRRAELTSLTLAHLQQRDGHWAIVNLYGKGGHVRTVPVPTWVKESLDRWTREASISEGPIFRRVSRTGKFGDQGSVRSWSGGLSGEALRASVLNGLHRTICAGLCHAAGGELEQIQFLLGHRSVETTERYLGSRQRIASAVNDRIAIEPDPGGP